MFYSNAYDALFQRHDATKGGFKRERYCSLDSQDFGSIFAAFSLVSYDKRLIQMSRHDATDFISKASDITGIAVPTEAYLNDSIQCVCLLVEEGLWIAFTHRSFQEYFVARFIESAKPEVQSELIERYSARFPQDSTLSLVNEMNAALLTRLFLLPSLNDLVELIDGRDIVDTKRGWSRVKINQEAHLKFLGTIASGVKVDHRGDMKIDFNDSALARALIFILETYGDLFPDTWTLGRVDWTAEVSRYADGGRVLWIGFKNLDPNDVLARDLYEGLGAFSVNGVRWFLRVREFLMQSQIVMDRSLSEILKL